MRRSRLAMLGFAFLLPGVLLSAGWAEQGASQMKQEELTSSNSWVHTPDLRGFRLVKLSFVPFRPFFAAKPRTSAPDNWLGGSGNWNTPGDWSAGIPGSSSVVTIGNTSSGSVTVTQAGAATAASVSILNGNTLNIAAGNTLTVGGATTVSSGADLLVGNGSTGGSILNSGGSLTNGGTMEIGNFYMTSASTVNVTGTYTGTGGTLLVDGGNAAGANGLLKISGAAPGTVTGNYELESNVGSAAVEWGSGGITQIGDGVSNAGYVLEQGAEAYLETGATNSNSALKGLATIASNGELQMQDGAAATTTGALTVASGGQLRVDDGGTGGSSLILGGSLTNSGYAQVGNYYMTSPSTLKVTGTFTGTGSTFHGVGRRRGG